MKKLPMKYNRELDIIYINVKYHIIVVINNQNVLIKMEVLR